MGCHKVLRRSTIHGRLTPTRSWNQIGPRICFFTCGITAKETPVKSKRSCLTKWASVGWIPITWMLKPSTNTPALLLIFHLPLVTKEDFDVTWIVKGLSVYLFKLVAVNADHNWPSLLEHQFTLGKPITWKLFLLSLSENLHYIWQDTTMSRYVHVLFILAWELFCATTVGKYVWHYLLVQLFLQGSLQNPSLNSLCWTGIQHMTCDEPILEEHNRTKNNLEKEEVCTSIETI